MPGLVVWPTVTAWFSLARLQYCVGVALLAEAYFVLGKLSLLLASAHPSASPVWPPAGLAFAALLLMGRRYWPAVFIGAFLVNATTDASVAASLGIAAGNTFEALVGCAIVLRFAGGGTKTFETVHGVLVFALFAGLFAPIVSASVGVASLSFDGSLLRENAPYVWLTWWMGDVVGSLTVAPFAVLWARSEHRQCGVAKAGEALFVFVLLLLIGAIVFSPMHYPLEYLCLLPVLWTAVRFSPRDTALSVVLTSVIAVAGTLRGWGPFAMESVNSSLLLLQAFVGVCSFLGLILSAAILERRLAEGSLEETVRERTEQLAHALEQDKANVQRLSHIIERITVAAIAVDERLKVLTMNEHFRDLFGIKRKTRAFATLSDVLSDIRHEFKEPHETVDGLLQILSDRVKTTDIAVVLKNDAQVFCDYIPLVVDGQHRGHIFICREHPNVFSIEA